MPTISVKIKNLPEIKAAFRKSPTLMARNLNDAIKKSIFAIQRESMLRTPVDTGRLRASHFTRFSSLYGEVGPTAFYAIYVHEGTRYMRGRPFLKNAVSSQEQRVQKLFVESVQKTLDEIARQT